MIETDITTDSQSRVELVIFKVHNLSCALKSTEVQEIIKNQEITPVHNAPDYVLGVINLRGSIVTVIDPQKKFNYEESGNERLRIVIVASTDESIGLLVDDVSDILKADTAVIDTPPANLNGLDGAYFSGIFKMEDNLVAILNLEELLKTGE